MLGQRVTEAEAVGVYCAWLCMFMLTRGKGKLTGVEEGLRGLSACTAVIEERKHCKCDAQLIVLKKMGGSLRFVYFVLYIIFVSLEFFFQTDVYCFSFADVKATAGSPVERRAPAAPAVA